MDSEYENRSLHQGFIVIRLLNKNIFRGKLKYNSVIGVHLSNNKNATIPLVEKIVQINLIIYIQKQNYIAHNLNKYHF